MNTFIRLNVFLVLIMLFAGSCPGQQLVSFPLSESLSSTTGNRTLTALTNDTGDIGSFGTLDVSNSNCGDVTTTSAYFFPDNAGLQFSNAGLITSAYSLEMTFKLDELLIRPTRTNDWVNIISFNQTTSDQGIYIRILNEGSGQLQFWNSSSSQETVTSEIFNTTDLFHLVLTRNNAGLFSIYVNGVTATTEYDDTDGAYVPNTADDAIYFFRDFPLESIPTITDKLDDEASPGWVRTLNISNTVWSDSEIEDRYHALCDRLTVPFISASPACVSDTLLLGTLNNTPNADSIVWDFGDGLSTTVRNASESTTHSYAATGDYRIEATAYYLGIGVTGIDTLTIHPLPVVELGPDQRIDDGSSLTLDATSSNVTHLWQDGSTAATLNVTTAGNYWVVVTNEFGCHATDSVLITFNEPPLPDIPKLITPNGDGENDMWVIDHLDAYTDTLIRLFDRQGNLLMEWDNYDNSWDGTLPNNARVKEATYFYILFGDDQFITKGSVSIIR